MVLMNTHPDYMVSIRNAAWKNSGLTCTGKYCSICERDTKAVLARCFPVRCHDSGAACMEAINHESVPCVYCFYETDTRVRIMRKPFPSAGSCGCPFLRKEGQARCEVIEGVHVNRIQPRVINERNKATYLFRLIKFFMKSSALLAKSTLTETVDILDSHPLGAGFRGVCSADPKALRLENHTHIHDIVLSLRKQV